MPYTKKDLLKHKRFSKVFLSLLSKDEIKIVKLIQLERKSNSAKKWLDKDGGKNREEEKNIYEEEE